MKRLSRLRDLDYRQMRKSVFEIADKWTDKISALGYAVFLHRLLLSITNHLPMTPFENSFGGALTAVLTLSALNLLVAYTPALRRRL